ncbi:MAG TPA: biosynthetic-type acetolactate synthase large subunit [Eubacteriales bacterium]|jgi:acetolactate synthase-1/2/3 large subunit|nr:biosynthetic-type acetolactate synthase large subunit [Clostridia bacterium]HRR89457.1 biosynthetic-type acetolactate synthase large subunit [Eubacteriales bacterium]HRU84541.1 biosynthetic-type acetolactate synthase large subunit [Eubacteriales bacterium]
MKCSGAKIIMEALLEQGVDTVFGYPGGTVLHIYDQLYLYSDKIRHVASCHEQGAAHAADGYARATGKTGVVIATSGPGATNLVTGIAAAYLDSTPLVAFTGNVPQNLIGRDSFQEVDSCGITMPITKHNFMVKDVKRLAATIREAFLIANSGRPGPVLIDIPKDIQIAECEYEPEVIKVASKEFKNGEKAFLSALEIIKASRRPFIYAGGGIVISGAEAELMEFANLIDAPIGTSMMGLSAVDADSPKFLGMTGMHGKYAASKLMSESDLIIAIGTRFSDRATGNKKEFINNKKVLHIDIDPAEIGKNIPAYVALVGDVKVMLKKLSAALKPTSRKEWAARIEEIKNSPDCRLEMDRSRLNPQNLIETVSKYAGDAVVATDVGQHQMWTAQYYKFKKPRTFITSGGLGAMGFGLGAAIGAAVGTGKKTILFTSDGSFHMNMNELATAVSNDLPILVIVINNNVLGMVRQWQTLFFDKRYSNTSLGRKTDYVKLAEAFGLTARRISDISELVSAVTEGLSAKGPHLIEAVIDSDEKVLPMIPPGGTIHDIILKA